MLSSQPLNTSSIVLEEAETQIRIIVKDGFVKKENIALTQKKVYKVILDMQKKIKIPTLRRVATISLNDFYKRQVLEMRKIPQKTIEVSSALYNLQTADKVKATSILKKNNILIDGNKVSMPSQNIYGVPLQKFSDDYLKKNVKPVMDRLAEQYPYDEETGKSELEYRNSLRNRAEMEVRHEEHESQIQGFKDKGVKLVICSSHADCSDRCAKWQGKVFSLDGTSGTTSDGRKYQPLENATDVYVTTKKGKTYKNGLLGFNCRHYLVEYKKGFQFPKPDREEERKQYDITKKQRALELQVRTWRTIAVQNKDIDRKRYLEAKAKAEYWNKQYIEFSQKNERAFYPSRTKII